MQSFNLKLFVAGESMRSQRAIDNLRRLCADMLEGQCEIEIVDITTHPQTAEDHKILVTPTLVKESPKPVRRIIGDLSEHEQVLYGLGLGTRGGLVGRTSQDDGHA